MFLETVRDSPSLEMINLVLEKISRGEKPVSLAIGEPSFDTPKEIVQAAYESILARDTHYVSSYGIPQVREAIGNKVRRKNGIVAAVANTIFTSSKMGVYAAMAAISNQSYEALIPDPGYFYSEPVIISGGKPIRYNLAKDFSLDLDEIKRKTTEDTKIIVVNTPSNPTGRVLERKQIMELYEFCRDRRIYILSDEAYEDIVYGAKHFSPGSLEASPEIVISLFSLSKSYSMTGWRSGYIVANEKIIYLVNKLFENTLTCFPPFIQKASAFALEKCDAAVQQFREELAKRRELMVRRIAEIDALTPNEIEGAFYAFPRYEGKITSREVSKRILQKYNVALLAGTSFGQAGEYHLRLSFSGSREDIQTGMDKVTAFFKKDF